MDEGRDKAFERSEQLTAVLDEINAGISSLQVRTPDEFRFPPILVFGCARSGTTLFMQWLASLGAFGYPTNLIARFYGKPYFGARVQQALYTFDPKKQIFPETINQTRYESNLGHTAGAFAPSEFWYFWRRFFSFGEIQKLDATAFAASDTGTFIAELKQLEFALGKPLLMKAMILNWNIPELHALFDRALFIHIERDDRFVAQSLYQARQKFFGDVSKWYSFKPPEYAFLKDLSPLEQVAGQAFFTKKAIREGFGRLPASSALTISHAEFCRNPAASYQSIRSAFNQYQAVLPADSGVATSFQENNTIVLGNHEFAVIESALRDFENGRYQL